MRYLWIVSYFMVAAGLLLGAAGLIGLLEPITMILGVLLLWSGVVKLIVLRIWRSSLNAAAVTPAESRKSPPGVTAGQH